TGGVTGKMISPQSIAIACAAVGLAGKESDLFRFTVKHSLFFVIIVGIMTYVQAYYLTWMIPYRAKEIKFEFFRLWCMMGKY
ncbi:L-lactate permease, partial [Bacillus cereus]|uniref:L-lactate permease n=1 Tax=Bacillus cereus TaxID=1396 RepID=UPI0018F6F475|nr:L-lactate permease [Bacillus cereus]